MRKPIIWMLLLPLILSYDSPAFSEEGKVYDARQKEWHDRNDEDWAKLQNAEREYARRWEVLNQKAAELYEKGDVEDSERTAKQALAIASKYLGENHLNVAKSLNNLAVLSVGKRDYAQALFYYEEVLKVEENRYGKFSPKIVDALLSLGQLNYIQKKYSKTDAAFTRILKITEQAFGEDHPRVIVALENLIKLYEEMGLHQEARAFYDRAQRIGRKHLGIPETPPPADTAEENAGEAEKAGENTGEAAPILLPSDSVEEESTETEKAADMTEDDSPETEEESGAEVSGEAK